MIVFNLTKAQILSENDRKHWAQKAPVVKALRTQSAIQHSQTIRDGSCIHGRARLVVQIAFPDRRRRDLHNLMPTIKALIDGAVDAGIILDDSAKYLEGPDLRADCQECDTKYGARLEFLWLNAEDVAA